MTLERYIKGILAYAAITANVHCAKPKSIADYPLVLLKDSYMSADKAYYNGIWDDVNSCGIMIHNKKDWSLMKDYHCDDKVEVYIWTQNGKMHIMSREGHEEKFSKDIDPIFLDVKRSLIGLK